MTDQPNETSQDNRPSRGFWSEVRRRFAKRRIGMIALIYVVLLAMVAAPLAGDRRHQADRLLLQGDLYFPALAYFNRVGAPIFRKDRFRNVYPGNLEEKDPDSWAVWPLMYQDPYRRVRDGEWPDQPANPTRDSGASRIRYNCSAQTVPASTCSRR